MLFIASHYILPVDYLMSQTSQRIPNDDKYIYNKKSMKIIYTPDFFLIFKGQM